MLVVAAAVIFLLTFYIFFKKSEKSTQLPEPPGNILLGHISLIKTPEKTLDVCTDLIKEYGTIVFMKFGPSLAPLRKSVLTTNYKLFELVLNSNDILTKGQIYNYLQPWLRNGLLISDGNYWKKHRKILTPAFHFGILKNFVEIFDRVGDTLVEKLKGCDGSTGLDLHPLVTLCTLDIICETAMGTKIDAQNGKNRDYVNSVKEMCRLVVGRVLSPLKVFDCTFPLTEDYTVQKKCLKILHDFTLKVINSKKRNGAKIAEKAFLDLLLKFSNDNDKLLSEEEIREEVDTFMFEGHDTTSSAVCFTLFCLANNPECQKKVLEEQKKLFGDEKNPQLSYNQLQEMKYLEYVIKEALRLFPSVPLISRITHKEIPFEQYIIPKNTNITFFIYGLHRNPEYFPDPETFNPDRFENFDGSLPYSYLPFSAGPRNCIGQKFAMLELKTLISKIVRNFELTEAVPRHNLILSTETVLKSTNGVKVAVKIRN